MKRIAIFAALAALLLLTACQKTPAADPVAPPVTDTQTTQTDTAPDPGDEEEIEEIPTQVVPSTDSASPSASPLEPVPAEVTATDNTVEEGIEDSVGYSYVLPVFSGFDGAQAVTDFYNALLTEMDAYARETVYETAQARHCVASVLGSYSLDGVRDNQLRVTYTVTADYAEGEDATSTRTDAFDMTTGEHLLLE